MPADWLLALFDIAAIAVVAWVGGTVAQRLRQPRIAGEMAAVFLAGLLLGGQIADVVPGQVAEGRIAALFPEAALAVVTVVGGLGLVLYMLLVGITIDPAPLRERAGAIMLLALASAGAMLALALVAGPLLVDAGGWKPPGVTDSAFVLALAGGLAANGLPIVARILEDRGMSQTAVGSVVIVAGTGATALAVIAAAVAIGGGDVPAGERVALRVGAGLVLLALVLGVARRRRLQPSPAGTVAAVVALAVGAALAGDELLSSLILGPLIIGIAVSKGGGAAIALERCLGVAVRRVGLPIFIGVAALHTDLRELDSGVLAVVAALLTAVIAVKVVVAYAAARTVGFGPADARAIGALMQCGGVMTIAVSLDILEAHLIDARMHAALTLLGLVTTIVAGPLLPRARHRLPRPRPAAQLGAEQV
ncbi:MAG TPA: cation:proton antiporter [Solirubrobacteraceae bacterium]|nr:cation:proton antiporter [Solirubrobacteraceae bacterium]